MSGSPIILPDGSAVGVVCISSGTILPDGSAGSEGDREGGPNPLLCANLPTWLVREAI
jgi:hypothetical protein